MRYLILGGGMVGAAMAADLASDDEAEVTVADVREDVLGPLAERYGVAIRQADLSDGGTVTRMAADHDVVLGALSSRLGIPTLRAVIEAGRNYVDISFMAEDARTLGPQAVEAGVTAVVDCGVAPGLSNMLCGWAARTLQPCERLAIYVGGLPAVRRWPYEYKAGFAPHDVIEEYTRPARLVEHGLVVRREALSEPELIDFPELGTLEAFNTDGLRSLADTLEVPFMIEKTMRYPGHIELMRVLRETGFFSKQEIEVGGVKVRPLDVTAALMFPMWTFEPGEEDLTIMRVIAEGTEDGSRVRYVWDLLDRYDPETELRSMSRTTGYPATIVARLLARGRFQKPGVHPPEVLGAEPGLLDKILGALALRDVIVERRVEALG
jgi:saccharopine dehydrogenase-like NADP-dependent oxidoreductase